LPANPEDQYTIRPYVTEVLRKLTNSLQSLGQNMNLNAIRAHFEFLGKMRTGELSTKTFSPAPELRQGEQGEDAAHKLHLRNTTHALNPSSAMSEADHMILAVKRFYGSDQWRIT
jgi:hypothetical protein